MPKSLYFFNNIRIYSVHLCKKRKNSTMAEEENTKENSEESLSAAAEEDAVLAPAETLDKDTQEKAVSDNTYLVKERFEIDYSHPLPELNANGAKAYMVKDKINPQRELFALLCDNNFPPRLSMLPYLKSIEHPNLLNLVDYSVVDYKPEKTMNMALIYSRPTGPKVSQAIPKEKPSFEKFKSLVLSLVSGCEALKNYNLTHRAIRMDNIFFKDEEGSELVLGDCAASFPALYQPNAYETQESLLCIPQGRGQGSSGDDVYSAGVVLLGLALGHEIAPKCSCPELQRLKLKKGSLATLSDGEKIPGQIMPLLKGMLEDSIESRWNSSQIYNYLDGKNPTFSPEPGDRSMRALSIGGEKYYTAKSVALAILENPADGLSVIKSGKLLEWIKNGLENEKLHNKIERLINAEKEGESNRLLLPQICIYLDYSLPIKCDTMYVFPSGLPKAIFHSLKTGRSLEPFHQILSGDLIKIWYQEQPYLHAPANSNEFRVYLSRNDYGYGIDRIIYDFDDDLPCTSPLIGKEFVNTPSKLLKALDSNYSENKEDKPYDKNIIAYLRSKMGKKIDGILTDINANQDALQISAVMRLYANIQNKTGPVQLLNLTKWLVKTAKPIIMNYHNTKYRKYLEQETIKISKSGKIIELYEILENEEAQKKDRTEYASVLKKVNILVTERNRILQGSPKLDEESRELAIKFGSILSILTMLSSFILSIIYWVFK